MQVRDARPCLILAVLVLAGCAGCAMGPQPGCGSGSSAQDAALDRDHAARVAAAEDESAQGRTPGEKGPSPEGIEAIALLEKEMLDARRETCARKGTGAGPTAEDSR